MELENALIEEEAALKAAEGEDEEMAGAEGTSGPPAEEAKAEDEDDGESDDGSEDLEAESSGSEDEEIEEEEGDGDEDMDMGEDGEAKPAPAGEQTGAAVEPSHGEVMVH